MPLNIVAVLLDPGSASFCLAGAAAAAAIDGGSRIEGFHARLKPESTILPTEEVLTAARRKKLEAAAAARANKLQRTFRAWAVRAGALGSNAAWQEVVVDRVESAVAARGRTADLFVLVRPDDLEGNAALRTAIFETGRPLLLLPPKSAEGGFGKHLAIAWKAGEPAERAVTAALPWLQRAERISVLTIVEAAGSDSMLPKDLSALLAGRGPAPIPVELQQGGLSIGERLLQAVQEIGADGLVMGAYQHHRITEMMLGGVTRDVLRQAVLPLFLMH